MDYDVTIGIPLYNAAPFIRRSLQSALAQSHASIEFLIVDDGSSDESVAVVRGLVHDSPRSRDVRILSQPSNMGVAAARNRIIDEARGEYLYFMDSDDTISPDAIALLMHAARLHQAEVVFGSYEKVELSGAKQLYAYPALALLEPGALAAYGYRHYAGIQASACNFIVKVALLRQHRHRFIEADYWEDMAFTFDLLPLVSRAVLLPDVTYTYRCREGSLSHYQQREAIAKLEVCNNIKVIDHLKATSARLASKPFFPDRCLCVMMTDFYIACHILKKKREISPSFTQQEIKALFRHPAALRQILAFRRSRLSNLALYLLGRLPSWLCVAAVLWAGKAKKLL